MRFQYLTNIHTARYAERIQNDIDGGTVFEIRHIFNRQYAGNNTLVTVTASHLVALGQFTLLCDSNPNQLIDASRQIAVFFTVEDFYIDDLAFFAVRQTQ